MPRTKYSDRLKTQANKWEPFMVLIRGTMKARGIEPPELAELTGMGQATLYRRFKTPQDFRQSELSTIARLLSIPWSELRDKIPE